MTKRPDKTVTLIPLKLPKVELRRDLCILILQTLKKQKLLLRDGDLLAVASKVVSTCEGQMVRLGDVRVSARARRIAKKWRMDENLAALVLDEADAIFGGVRGFLLTMKNGIMTANAGIDLKNCPTGTCMLWPRNPDSSARRLRKSMQEKHDLRLGVEIVDSRVTPLRLGTTGLAIGMSGFLPVRDERSKRDLYGRKVRVTQTNIGDDLAASAHFLMGETDEQIGGVIIRNAAIQLTDEFTSSNVRMKISKCLISSNLQKPRRI